VEELVKNISKKLGLSEDMARQAVDMVISFIKDKLPDSIATQLDAFLGSDDLLEQAGDIAEGLEGLLGGLGKK
jgi:uncharacterized protein (DUF2267 family)